MFIWRVYTEGTVFMKPALSKRFVFHYMFEIYKWHVLGFILPAWMVKHRHAAFKSSHKQWKKINKVYFYFVLNSVIKLLLWIIILISFLPRQKPEAKQLIKDISCHDSFLIFYFLVIASHCAGSFLRDCAVLTLVLVSGSGSRDEERLVRDLFRGYNKLIRPVQNMTQKVEVAFGLAFIQLISVVRTYLVFPENGSLNYLCTQGKLDSVWKKVYTEGTVFI